MNKTRQLSAAISDKNTKRVKVLLDSFTVPTAQALSKQHIEEALCNTDIPTANVLQEYLTHAEMKAISKDYMPTALENNNPTTVQLLANHLTYQELNSIFKQSKDEAQSRNKIGRTMFIQEQFNVWYNRKSEEEGNKVFNEAMDPMGSDKANSDLFIQTIFDSLLPKTNNRAFSFQTSSVPSGHSFVSNNASGSSARPQNSQGERPASANATKKTQSPLEQFSIFTQLPVNSIKEYSLQELKKAYHQASLKMHPDKVKEANREVATQTFQELTNAYETLKLSQY